MILNMDIKGLEVVCAAYLSKDPVLYKELNEDVDIHSMNQEMLGLPEGKLGRGIAKIFKFRLLYGGMYFHNDPDFASVSSSKKFWDKMIDKYYEKYSGIYKWHQKIIKEAAETGMLTSPTGRTFKFDWKENWRGEKELPVTQIKNYPVQSLGADIMSVIRVDFYRRFMNAGIPGKLVNTVHDSIVLDLVRDECDSAVLHTKNIISDILRDFPSNFERVFGIPFNLEIKGEMEVGNNMYDMESI